MLKADGFDEAAIGICSRAGHEDVIAYDTSKCIDILMDQGMDHDDAFEFFMFNVESAYMGPLTPVFIQEMDMEEIEIVAEEQLSA